MSRMFRVISGTEATAEPEPFPRPAVIDGPDAEHDVPFIEVGGPDGVVTSIRRPAVSAKPVPPRPMPAARAKAAPATTAPRPQPAPAPESPVLSVTFHRFPKPGLRMMAGGVAPDVVAYHFPDHPVSGEYRLVCEEVLRQYENPAPRAAVFAAARPHAGTTTVLTNFAVSLVQQHGSRVLLVDANFARPGIARRLACADSPGLAEVLGQAIPLAWALQPTPLPNLHVLSTGMASDGTEEALAADLPRLAAQLRQWFDWVVIDAGVWSELPGADATAAAADGVYLVTREPDMDAPDVVALRSEISALGGPVRGFVSTRQ